MNHKRNYQPLQEIQSDGLYQYEMGYELGADVEEAKTMHKQEYCKDELSQQLRKLNEKQNSRRSKR